MQSQAEQSLMHSADHMKKPRFLQRTRSHLSGATFSSGCKKNRVDRSDVGQMTARAALPK